ncbi:ABC transporter ATP-binding protein [Donghicola sp. C2-DW-16]|uniref:ABC transporter ATP-binding protein n=1 Tax=Donghicola mangrovi TaxID=2729614 RepID=A0ABX2PI45_9RHOB|nr:ABC transporter ATP-binding protein [Donghicola mangrovi]NVO29185.1 ABC transporter ATP-binding protein [Donghicola mangrovi]
MSMHVRKNSRSYWNLYVGFGIIHELARYNWKLLFLAFAAMLVGGFFDGISMIYILALLSGAVADADGKYHVNLGGMEVSGWQIPSLSVSLELALLLFLSLILLTIFMMRFRAIQLNRLLFGFTNQQRQKLFSAVSLARWQDIQTRNDSDIEHALTGEIDRITGCIFSALNFVQATIFAIIYIGFGIAISWPMMIALLGISAILWLSMAPFRNRSSMLGYQLQQVRGLQYRLISVYLTNLKAVRASNTGTRWLERFNDAIATHTSVSHSFAGLSSTAQGAFQFGSAAAIVIFLFIGLQFLKLPLAEIVILIVVLARVAMRVQAMQSSAQIFLSDVPAWLHIKSLIGVFQNSAAQMPKLSISVPQISQNFMLEGVNFSYDTAEIKALKDISIEIKAKTITAIVGPSGSGKSTLVDVLLGLLTVEDGEIALDGMKMRPEMFSSWRDQISYVGQEVALINGTIRENLLANLTSEPNEQELLEAIDFAAATDFVAKLPNGLDEPVGERGALLSGGQRQRIAIAASILSHRPVLILDEATSALDWEAQMKILDGLAKLRAEGKTVVLVAHRPSVVLRSDYVYVLDKGVLAEQGQVDKLSSIPESYLSKMIEHELKKTSNGTAPGWPVAATPEWDDGTMS